MENVNCVAPVKFSRKVKFGLSVVALLGALEVSQYAFAYPQVLKGYAGVVVYYSGSDQAYIVGRKVVVSGCTAEYPQPVEMAGGTSAYSEFRIYGCGQVPSPNPPVVD